MNRSIKLVNHHKRSLLERMWKHRTFYLFLLPAIVFTLIFFYRPYLWLSMAFQDFSFNAGLSGSPFVGLQNFKIMFANPDFLRALRNTLVINIAAFILGFPAPIIFALLLNELRTGAFKRVTQTITYMPHFVSWIIVSGLFYRLLDFENGTVNLILETFGFQAVPFMRKAALFQPMIILLSIWKEVGWYSIIYLASITSIDPNLYDAAQVDGASRLQQVFNVTIPGIANTISVMLVLTVGRIATGGGIIPNFDAVYPMLNPFLYETGEILQVHTYTEGLTYGRLSYATAVGITQSAVALILVLLTNYRVKKVRQYGVY